MNRLLVVVDYQNDFVTGALGFPRAEALSDAICEKVKEYRRRGDEVAFTLDTHDENYLSTEEGRQLPVVHCVQGTDGWRLHPSMRALRTEDDAIFCKPTFGSMDLANYVRKRRYSRIELVGVVTNICVISNAVLCKAALPEAVVSVDAACTAGPDEELHQKALDVMEGLQIQVTNR